MNGYRSQRLFWNLLIWGLSLSFSATCSARDIYVNPQEGDNTNSGTKLTPLSGCKRAVAMAQPGDVIHLLPAGSIYRQSIVLSDKKDLLIEGNGVTLDGADPISAKDWEEVSPKLFRRKINRQRDRFILVVNGKSEKMGRSAGKLDSFPPPEKLKSGQFCYQPIDEKSGWLYVAGSMENLEWATRENGIGTRGVCANIRINNLNARHFLNDGFNVHGKIGTGVIKFVSVQGYDCFDEGISVHDYCSCEVEKSAFWGCDRAVADVHSSETHYRDCEFSGSADIDVHFRGKSHSLTNCKIINNTSAAALTVGPPDAKRILEFSMLHTQIDGKLPDRARVKIAGSKSTIKHCDLKHVEVDTVGSEIVVESTTIDGPWKK